jgi:putative phage-type endonuclease
MAEQGTQEWLEERAGKVTASALSNVMMAKTAAGYQNYMAQIICEVLTGKPTETFKSSAMEYGSETEPQARAFYELESGNEVTECGFIPHPTLQMSGASPDGLVGDVGLVEIKVPQPAKHIKNLMGGTVDKAYSLQMQWQMECTGREWCDFVSFNPTFPDHLKIHIQRVERDAEMAAEIKAAVSVFLSEVDAKLRVLNARAA